MASLNVNSGPPFNAMNLLPFSSNSTVIGWPVRSPCGYGTVSPNRELGKRST